MEPEVTDRYPLRDGVATFEEAQRNTLAAMTRSLAQTPPDKITWGGWSPEQSFCAHMQPVTDDAESDYVFGSQSVFGNRNWTEDAADENGNYQNQCGACHQMFVGHKRRAICRACAHAPVSGWQPPPDMAA